MWRPELVPEVSLDSVLGVLRNGAIPEFEMIKMDADGAVPRKTVEPIAHRPTSPMTESRGGGQESLSCCYSSIQHLSLMSH